MKITKLISLFALLFLAFSNMQFVSYAGDLAKDTVWTKRTDQLQGFFSLQFIKNDQIIVAQAIGYTIFYDASNGNELKRILGSNKALFFNEEKNFLRLNNDSRRFEIFDTESYEIIGELESDDMLIQEYSSYVISKDENFLVGVVSNGLRVWDLKSKKILRTKITELNTSLVGINIDKLDFVNNTTLLIGIRKDYKNNQGSVYTRTKDLIDFQTLDSIGTWGDKGSVFRVSPSSKYIAFGIGGVQIYNLETGELVSTLKLNSDALTGIEFSNDESYIVTSSTTGDNNIKTWDVKNGNELYQYGKAGYSALSISNNQNFILGANGKTLLLFKSYFNTLSIENKVNTDTIYPNPASKRIEVRYNIINPSFFKIEITNFSGQKLYFNEIGFKNSGVNFESLDVSQYINGIYNVRIYSDFEMINLKFIKE